MRKRIWLVAVLGLAAACGPREPAGGATEPTEPVEPVGEGQLAVEAPGGVADTTGGGGTTAEDACATLGRVMCELQGVEGERCAALQTRIFEKGSEYCTTRLPDMQAQIETARTLLAEEIPAGQEIPLRAVCPAAERVTVPATPDPESGEFTLEEALAGQFCRSWRLWRSGNGFCVR